MLLFINSCARGENSRTLKLCREFLLRYKSENPEDEILEVDIYKENVSYLTAETLAQRDKLIAEKDFENPMFALARQFAKADKILIGAPLWDFSFPAALKCYIENICVKDVTFRYSETGAPVSLCSAEKSLYISTIGGTDLPDSCGYGYINTVFSQLFNICDNSYYSIELLDVVGQDQEEIMKNALADAKDLAMGF